MSQLKVDRLKWTDRQFTKQPPLQSMYSKHLGLSWRAHTLTLYKVAYRPVGRLARTAGDGCYAFFTKRSELVAVSPIPAKSQQQRQSNCDKEDCDSFYSHQTVQPSVQQYYCQRLVEEDSISCTPAKKTNMM